jgi:hypothetical protein
LPSGEELDDSHQRRTSVAGVRPATAIVVVLLLALIVVAFGVWVTLGT